MGVIDALVYSTVHLYMNGTVLPITSSRFSSLDFRLHCRRLPSPIPAMAHLHAPASVPRNLHQ